MSKLRCFSTRARREVGAVRNNHIFYNNHYKLVSGEKNLCSVAVLWQLAEASLKAPFPHNLASRLLYQVSAPHPRP